MEMNHSNEVTLGKVNTTQVKLMWVIEEFEEKIRNHKNIVSPVFTTLVDHLKTEWKLSVCLEEKEEDDNYISVWLECLNNDSFKVSLEFAIFDTNNQEVNVNDDHSDTLIDTELIGVTPFITKSEFNLHKATYMNNSAFTIVCTITTNKYIDIEMNKSKEQAEKALKLQEFEHLRFLFENETYSDIKFSVEGREIHAHKNILATRSPVFEAMFKHDMKEATSNTVVVEDISYSTMYDLLKFMYSGTVPVYPEQEHFENYKNLMIAANKYSINNLKLECERRLANNLRVSNVFENLNMADTHNATSLKEKAIEFIAINGDDIIDSPIYMEFGKLHPEISCEVFRALVIKRRKTD